MPTVKCFTRTWWRKDANGKLIPRLGRKTTMRIFDGKDAEEQAIKFCDEWNESHNPGPLSRKCEWTGI